MVDGKHYQLEALGLPKLLSGDNWCCAPASVTRAPLLTPTARDSFRRAERNKMAAISAIGRRTFGREA